MDDVVHDNNPQYVSYLYQRYVAEYRSLCANDEESANIENYAVQHLTEKIKSNLHEVVSTGNESKKRGNSVYSNSLSFDDAISKMRLINLDAELVRSATLTIMNELLKLEKTKILSPASIYTLKSSAPVIPNLTNLFYRTLIDGLNIENTDISECKVIAMVSDSMLNVTKGSVKPWKHTLEGLGFVSTWFELR